jgi:hypothetical protein
MDSIPNIEGVLNESEDDFLLALFPIRISRERWGRWTGKWMSPISLAP